MFRGIWVTTVYSGDLASPVFEWLKCVPTSKGSNFRRETCLKIGKNGLALKHNGSSNTEPIGLSNLLIVEFVMVGYLNSPFQNIVYVPEQTIQNLNFSQWRLVWLKKLCFSLYIKRCWLLYCFWTT